MSEETDWSAIVHRGAESDELDYKAAQNWNDLSRTGRAKFVRHCLAMANTKGGYVVVGVGEDADGRPVLATGLDPEQSKSFDPTAVGSFVSRCSDPPVEFTLERPVVDGKRFAIFAVRKFTTLPHVCTATCGEELLQGVFYIRTPDASSRPAFRATEIHGIIQRALRNQRELLGRMLRGILYENHVAEPEQDEISRFQEELRHSRMFFRKHASVESGSFELEFSAYPAKYAPEGRALSEIRSAAEESYFLYPEQNLFSRFVLKDAYFTNTSLRAFTPGSDAMFQIFRSGLIHVAGRLPFGTGKRVSLKELVLFTARSCVFAAEVYSRLGYTDEMLTLSIRLTNVDNACLDVSPGESSPRCRIPEILAEITRSASDFSSGTEEHAARLLKSVCERFNLTGRTPMSFLPSVTQALRKK